MAIQIKSLTLTKPVEDTSNPASSDDLLFNTIPGANKVYDLYIAPNVAANPTANPPVAQNIKNAIVKTVRLVNTHTAPVKISLYFMRPTALGQYRRRLVSPSSFSLAPGTMYVDDDEITLEPGDHIQAMADVANVIQYVMSGIERDVS